VKAWDAAIYDRDYAFVAAHGEDLLEWLAVEPGESVVDLGCGTGVLTARIAESGASVIAIDTDPVMIDAARERVPKAELRIADGHDFSVAEPVDAVFSNAALHWMPASVEVLGCVSDALRLGGRFVAEMGGSGNVAAVTAAVDQACDEAGLPAPSWPWFFPTPAQYAAMLEDAGLEVRSLEFWDRPTRLTGADGLTDWLAMFAREALGDAPPSVLERATEIARPELWRDGSWWADYRRLRFRAVKIA